MDLSTRFPAAWYVSFLLGIEVTSHVALKVYQWKLRYVLPAIWCVTLICEVVDICINFRPSAKSPLEGLVKLMAHGTLVINLPVTLLSLLSFIGATGAVTRCLKHLATTDAVSQKPAPSNRKSFKTAWGFFAVITVVLVGGNIATSLVKEAQMNGSEPRVPYLFWSLTYSAMYTWRTWAVVVGDLLLYPLCFTFIFLCIALFSRARVFETRLAELTYTADAVPDDLFELEKHFVLALEALNEGFSGFFSVVVVGKMMVLFVYVADFFDGYKTPMSYILQTIAITRNVALLLAVILYAARLSPPYVNAKILWARIYAGQEKQKKDGRQRAQRQTLQSMMPAISLRPEAVTMGGMANVTTGFLATLVTTFLGVVCFVLDQNRSAECQCSRNEPLNLTQS